MTRLKPLGLDLGVVRTATIADCVPALFTTVLVSLDLIRQVR